MRYGVLGILAFVLIAGVCEIGVTAEQPQKPPMSEKELSREEEFFRLEENMLSIAALQEQRSDEAPSIVYVLTDQDIKELGIRNLYDALKLVPGCDIGLTQTGDPRIGVRGAASFLSSGGVVTQDGYRLDEGQTGSATVFNFALPVANIKRIEVVRGPGSILYGPNGFSGIINIVTKDSLNTQGAEISIGGGSHDARQYNVLFGQSFGDMKFSGFFQYFESDGANMRIEEDVQTVVDRILSPFDIPAASLAPGDTDERREAIDANVSVIYKGVTLRGRVKIQKDGDYAGFAGSLGDSTQKSAQYHLNALYERQFGNKGYIALSTYFLQNAYQPDYMISPPGFTIPEDRDGNGMMEMFPDGRRLRFDVKSRSLGGEFRLHYPLSEHHTGMIGGAFTREETFQATAFANYDLITSAAFGSLQKIAPPYPEKSRNIVMLFAQDSWTIQRGLSLTGGVRYEHYENFGEIMTPKGGVVWELTPRLFLKTLYGHAFRAPTLVESFGFTGFLRGNPNLHAESIHTFEVEAGYHLSKNFRFEVNTFYNTLRDMIVSVPDPQFPGQSYLINSGKVHVWGVETSVQANFTTALGKENRLFANYTYLAPDEHAADVLTDIPHHLANSGLTFSFKDHLLFNTSCLFRSQRTRAATDSRGDLAAYAIVNANLLVKDFFKTCEISGTISNVFDQRYADPLPQGIFPGDLPRPGSSVFVNATYQF